MEVNYFIDKIFNLNIIKNNKTIHEYIIIFIINYYSQLGLL